MHVRLAALALLASSCFRPPPPAGPSDRIVPDATTRFVDPRNWLCLPGRNDVCATDLAATDLHADGTRSIEHRAAAVDPKVDCFYVYPTVDLDPIPKNHDDFTDVGAIEHAALAQAAHFREACALYVPLYRQATIGSYLHEDTLEDRLAFAYADIEAAFREFVADKSRGRPIVLIGHSQGAEMVVRLLHTFFENDPTMRAHLLLAMPIGGDVEVAKGSAVGGTFTNIPACTRQDQAGCVVAYRSYEAGTKIAPGRVTPRAGDESVCVNPAGFGDDAPHLLSRAYLPVTDRTHRWLRGFRDVETPFVELRDFYVAQCTAGTDGYRYLAISLAKTPGDQRENPLDFDRMPLHDKLGLHALDFQLPQGDLVDLVARRAAALR